MNKKTIFISLIIIFIVLIVFFKCSCSGNIIGNKSSKVLHLQSCYLVKKIKWKNLIKEQIFKQGSFSSLFRALIFKKTPSSLLLILIRSY